MSKFSMTALKAKSEIQIKVWQNIVKELENLLTIFPYTSNIKACKRVADFFNEHITDKTVLSYHIEKQYAEPYMKCELTHLLPTQSAYNIENSCTLRLWLDSGRVFDIVAVRQEIYQAKANYVNKIETLQKQMEVAEESVSQYLALTKRINELQGILPSIMRCDNIGNIEL